MFQQITALDLAEWASRIASKPLLPALVRRLVHATTPGVARANIPAFDDVFGSGWDGLVESPKGSVYVPAGVSLWEMSTESAVKQKADEDYAKRLADPLGQDIATSTFIFLTLRKWVGKEKWARERQAEAHWADVRAYDASDIEQWLELAPAVQFWAAARLGRLTNDAESLSEFWDRWAGATEPRFSAAMLLAGRQHAQETILRWLSEVPSLITIQADSRDEAAALLGAVLSLQPAGMSAEFLSRSVIARSAAAFAELAACPNPLVIVASTGEEQPVALRGGNHHVFLAVDPTMQVRKRVTLPRLRFEPLRTALVAAGLANNVADGIARRAGGRVAPLRRRLAHPSIPQGTAWSDPAHAGDLVGLLLVGAWDEDRPADKLIVEQVARRTYDPLVPLMVRWLNSPDPPLRRSGTVWRWVSRADAWWLLAQYVSPLDLDALEAAAVSVLIAADPRLSLPADERWLAGVRGALPSHSPQLRAALAEALALLGAASEIDDQAIDFAAGRAARAVRAILDTTDIVRWASVTDVLPLLAEASPGAFLDCVDRLTSGLEPPVVKLFAEEKGLVFSRSGHTALLWALEALAWDAQNLARVTVVLGRLARLDPGGSLANRPLTTLRHIFLGWYPQTAGSLNTRLDALDALTAAEPEVGWKTLLSVLPQLAGDHAWPLYKPRWRTWHERWTEGVTRGEYLQHLDAVVSRVVRAVGEDPQRWVSVLESFPQRAPAHRGTLLDRLQTLASSCTEPARSMLWHQTRKTLHRSRMYEEAKWALLPDEVSRLADILTVLAPADLVERHGWLYSWDAQLPDPPRGADDDWKVEEEAVGRARDAATREIIEARDPLLLLRFAAHVKEPSMLGHCVGGAELSDEAQAAILDAALNDSENPPILQFLRSFVGGRFARGGYDWAKRVLDGRAPRDQARLAAGLPFEGETWDLVVGLGADAEERYWSHVQPRSLSEKTEDGERGLVRLLQAGRPWVALVLAEHCIETHTRALLVPGGVVADVLEAAGQSDAGTDVSYAQRSHGYHVGALIDALVRQGTVAKERLARIEWLWLRVFSQTERYFPQVLHRKLGGDPTFFAEVVAWAFRSEADVAADRRDASPEHRARGDKARELLHGWNRVPGHAEDGSLDSDHLREWVRHARQECAARDRAGIGDDQIGSVLAHAPDDPDGAWPCMVLREIVEESCSPELDDGLRVGVYNRRGVVTRSLDEGGDQERQLAAQYRQWATASSRWPRMGRILERLAEGYASEALLEDLDRARDDD